MKKVAIALALLALACGPPPKVVNCSMTADGILDVFMNGNALRVSFPRVLVFDRDGGLVFTHTGYSPATAGEIRRATHQRAKSDAARIERFAAYLRTADGEPLDPKTLAGSPTVVQLGADWCKPCHALEHDLRRVPGITLLLVDADTTKHKDEIQAAMKKRFAH